MWKCNVTPEEFAIDVTKIPPYKADYLAAATLRAIKDFLKVPGNKEWLDKKVEERNERKAREAAQSAAELVAETGETVSE